MANATPVEAPFRLRNSDPVISEADGTASQWSDLWKYQVPVGVALIIKPEHVLFLYLEDTSPAEVGEATCRVKVEKRDSTGSSVVLLYGPELYLTSKEQQDRTLMARFAVPADSIVIGAREYLVISAYDDGTIDASDSYFELYIAKIRRALQT